MSKRKRRLTRSQHSVREDLAEQIRRVWIELYRMKETQTRGFSNYSPGAWWDGGKMRNGTTRPNSWLGAAAFFQRRGLPILPFVNYVIFHYTAKLPRPNILTSEAAADAYLASFRQSRDKRIARARTLLDSNKEKLHLLVSRLIRDSDEGFTEERMTDQQIQVAVLTDSTSGLSPLFRYCAAQTVELEKVAEDLEPGAMLEYAADPQVYDETWGDFVPEGFRNRYTVERRS